MNQNQIGRTVFDIDEETDALYLQKAIEYHEWLLQQEAQPRLTRTPIFCDREDAERRLRADYFDDHGSSEDILNTRSTLLKELDDINTVDSLEKAQKAKIHWAIEGDETSKYFHGVSINNSLTISNLFYANDAVFIEEVDLAAREVDCSTFSPPFTHLGVKVGGGMSIINSWDEVLCKVSSRLSKWKLKTLSIGGRLILIKSVLSSIPLYHMSIFKVPMGVLHSTESIRRNFFNGIDGWERKLALISWKKVLVAKKYGGLGVSSFFAFNRFSLWARCIKAIYGDRGAMDSFESISRRSPWLDIVRETKSLIKKHRYPRLYALELSKHISVSEKLSSDSLVFSFRRIPRGGIEEEQQCSLQARIEGIILAPMSDCWIWSYESSGEFSVKSARSFIDDSLLPKEEVSTRWVNVIPIKINVFAWRVRLDKPPTRLNLSLRGVDIPFILCPLCNISVESISHLLFSCSLARHLRSKFLRWWELEHIELESYEDWLQWFNNVRLTKRIKEMFE
nr:RNA-directed DNA polymerase, eukaryota, reverse transcriptase zinc-binding domain protein [Tanacetum cinerariifolium]